MTIGEAIKKARIDKGYTVKELSIETGIRQSTISAWERSDCTPTVILLCCIADVLKVSLDELCGRSTEKSSTSMSEKEPPKEHIESLTGKERKYRILAKRPADKKWSPWNDTNDINKVVEIVNRVKELGYMVEVRD